MTIDLQHSELEALIRVRMRTGKFPTVEDALIDALKNSKRIEENGSTVERTGRTGADLIAAMQACPFPDFEFGVERTPIHSREVEI
jgi:hypothetical protein